MKKFNGNVIILMSVITFVLSVFIVFLKVYFPKEKITPTVIESVEKSPPQLEKPRYELKRHSCENYVCDPQ